MSPSRDLFRPSRRPLAAVGRRAPGAKVLEYHERLRAVSRYGHYREGWSPLRTLPVSDSPCSVSDSPSLVGESPDAADAGGAA